MTKRIKKVVVVAPDENGAKEALRSLADASSNLKKLEGEIELKVQAVYKKYETNLDAHRETIEQSRDKLQAYCEANKEDLFKKKKSLDWPFGTIGYRTGNFKLDKPRKVTWDRAAELFKKSRLSRLIKTKVEVDKQKIIASRKDKKLMKKLADLAGIKVVQDETFFVEPKEEKEVSA